LLCAHAADDNRPLWRVVLISDAAGLWLSFVADTG